MDYSIVSSAGCEKFASGSPYCFRYCLSDRVFDMGGVPVSATRAGGDIFLGFSCRDAHHIAGGYFSLAFGLSARDSCPLLAFNNARIDPYYLSL